MRPMARSKSKREPTALALLRRELESREWGRNRFARELGVSPTVITRLLRGDREPTLRVALKIEALLGVAVQRWAA